MSQSHATICQIALALVFLTTGVSAQRYTGHDHAVFHRQPQTPPSATRHQSPSSAGNAVTTHQKTTASASPPSQQPTSRSGGSQGKLEVDGNHNTAPAKTEPALENAPHRSEEHTSELQSLR